jgi:hypothetical protein
MPQVVDIACGRTYRSDNFGPPACMCLLFARYRPQSIASIAIQDLYVVGLSGLWGSKAVGSWPAFPFVLEARKV